MPRGHCGARCNTVDPATRWCCALVEAYARRRLAQRRDRCHRPKQPAELEEDVWISPALAGRDADVPLEGAHRQEPGGAHNWSPGHRGSHPRGRAQSHDLAGTPSVRPYRVNSWGEGKFPGETRFMQQRPILVDTPKLEFTHLVIGERRCPYDLNLYMKTASITKSGCWSRACARPATYVRRPIISGWTISSSASIMWLNTAVPFCARVSCVRCRDDNMPA